MKSLKKILCGLLALALSGAVFAQTGEVKNVDGVNYTVVNYNNAPTSIKFSPDSKVVFYNSDGTYTYLGGGLRGSAYGAYIANSTANSASTQLTTTAIQETEIILSNIGARIHNVFTGKPAGIAYAALGLGDTSGLNAGDEEHLYGLWAQGGWARVKDTNAATKFKATHYAGTMGIDAALVEGGLLGAAFTYGRLSDGKTDYNFGTLEHNSYTISPYAAYRINEFFSLDVIGGYTRVDKKFKREGDIVILNGAVSRGPNSFVVNGKTDSDRWFFGVAGNAMYSWEDMNFLLRLGYTYLEEEQKAFTETNGDTTKKTSFEYGVLNLEGRIGYLIEEAFEPFVKAGYNNNTQLTKFTYVHGPVPKYKKSGYMLGGGMNFYMTDSNLTANIEGEFNKRDTVEVVAVRGLIRYMF